jgi:hypothetical protein
LPTAGLKRNGGHGFIKPNYEIDTLQCYRAVAEGYLVNRQEPQILSAVQHSGNFNENWPSWIPNWNVVNALDLKHPERPPYRGVNSFITKKIYKGHECLSLGGILIDDVTLTIHQTTTHVLEQYLIKLYAAPVVYFSWLDGSPHPGMNIV